MARILLALRRNGELFTGEGEPPPLKECVWRWTDTEVSNVPDVCLSVDAKAGQHNLDEDLSKLVGQLLTIDSTRVRIYQRQPIIVTGREHDRILILDTWPSNEERTVLSIVVSTNHVDTRHCGCVKQVAEVLSRLRGHQGQLIKTETTAYVVAALLKLPIWDIQSHIEYLEEQVVRIEHKVKPGMFFGIGKSRRRVSGLRVELSGYRKLLKAYERVCSTLIDVHSGAYSHGMGADNKEVQEYIGGLRLSVEAGIASAQQLREALEAIEALLSFEQTDRTNKLLAWMSLVLLPASLAAALLSMNFDLPGETNGLGSTSYITVEQLMRLKFYDALLHLHEKNGGFGAGLIFCLTAIPFAIVIFLGMRGAAALVGYLWECFELRLFRVLERYPRLKEALQDVPVVKTRIFEADIAHRRYPKRG